MNVSLLILTFWGMLGLACLWWTVIMIRKSVRQQVRDPFVYVWTRILTGLYARDPLQRLEPSDKLVTLPNFTTAIGIGTLAALSLNLLPAAIRFVWEERVSLILIALMSDVFDGFFARSARQCSRIGELIDPLRDRLFVCYVLLFCWTTYPGIGFFLFVIAVLEATIVSVAWSAYRQDIRLDVHWVGKLRMGIHGVVGLWLVVLAPDMATGRLSDHFGQWLTSFAPGPDTAKYAAWAMILASLSALVAYTLDHDTRMTDRSKASVQTSQDGNSQPH